MSCNSEKRFCGGEISGDGGRRLTIADLSFDQQIVIWALRTWLQRSDGPVRVHRQLYRAMPPAAARVATDSLGRLVALLTRRAARPLGFQTLSSARVSRDEQIVLALMHAVEWDGPSAMRGWAEALIATTDVEPLITSVASLSAALESRHAGATPKTIQRFVSTLIH